MYKLIALDMDGTLLNDEKKITEKTKKTISEARKNGKYVVLCSGRPIEGIDRYLDELNMNTEDDYVISFNGSLVQHAANKKVIGKKTLKGEDLKYLFNISRELGVNIHGFSKEGCITPKISKYTELEGKINGITVKEFDYTKIEDKEDISKVMMIDEPEILQKAIDNLPKDLYEKYTVVRSAPYFLEFLNKDANKGTGVGMLAEHLGIKKEEVICVGDAGNDLHMIEYAGLGVAMKNATDDVKEKASYITKSNNEDGVAHVIETFMLK